VDLRVIDFDWARESKLKFVTPAEWNRKRDLVAWRSKRTTIE